MDRTLPANLVQWMGTEDNMVVSYAPEGGIRSLVELVDLLAKNVEAVVVDPVGVLDWRDMERLLPSAAKIAALYNSIVVLVNHTNKLGVPNGQQWTSFYCSQRLEMRQGEVHFSPETGQSEAMTVAIRTTKNAHGPNFRESEMSFHFNEELTYV